jgi:hypothetical protein
VLFYGVVGAETEKVVEFSLERESGRLAWSSVSPGRLAHT